MAPKDMPQDAVIGNKNVSNKDVMPDAGKVKLGKSLMSAKLSLWCVDCSVFDACDAVVFRRGWRYRLWREPLYDCVVYDKNLRQSSIAEFSLLFL